jgi:hypothetical protein
MAEVAVEAVLAGLKGFQRDAVDHVVDRFYGPGSDTSSRRFLIADETGLGKSIVARGVIARAIEHLEHVDEVRRIDVVYVCSNRDLATQNLRRLNVTGDAAIPIATRLTMLAREVSRLNSPPAGPGKKVNLVSFTPATSFPGSGWATGDQNERALLALILREIEPMSGPEWRATRLLLRQGVRTLDRFTRRVDELYGSMGEQIDATIVDRFHTEIRDSLLPRFLELRDALWHKQSVPPDVWKAMWTLTGQLRHALAKASLDALEPDLVILDEFQRFRDLLKPPEASEAAELAHHLFQYKDARVLLLSATPYKPFTASDEAEDDHYEDFVKTIEFLANWDTQAVSYVREALEQYRSDLVGGRDAQGAADHVRAALLPYLTRSERPNLAGGFTVRTLDVAVPTVDDLTEYATLRAFGDEIGAPIDVEYWKSIPYFANFMEGYSPGERARRQFGTPEGAKAAALLASTRALDPAAIAAFDRIDLGNGYLRAVADETTGRDWWRMLWMPPSMPYLEPGPVYRGLSDVTKRVVFSAWTGVPTSVATLLSYVADRSVARSSGGLFTENTPEARRRVAERFTYKTAAGDDVGALSTLALFWPHPGLASKADPLAVARAAGRRFSADSLERTVRAAIGEAPQAAQVWDAFFSQPRAVPLRADPRALVAQVMADQAGEDDDSPGAAEDGQGRRGVVSHVEAAMSRMRELDHPLGHPDLARLAAHAPGTIAYRAIARIAGPGVTPAGHWAAAFVIANGIRRLFSRTEATALLVGLYGDGARQPYWSSVLSYCADGNLQAVLDEYLFQLRSELGGSEVDDAVLALIAQHCADVLTLRPAPYEAHDTTNARNPIRFSARFGLRYGGRFVRDGDDKSGARLADVRAAFNSPFAPFVLVSTSVGQEGIDFHWWSHAVVHWNLPGNPVDFEQREGRVNRFAGHAIRRNVAAAHWTDVLASDDPDPWRAAFDAATRAASSSGDLGEFAPWWVYPGPAQIQRIVPRYPLSRDIARYERLRDSLALYRLTLGQPRQEDMVELLRQRGVDGATAPMIDLRPPLSPRREAGLERQ